MADRRPLIHDTSDLSDTAENTPALPSLGFSNNSHHISPPNSPPHPSRPEFARLQSDATAVERETPGTKYEEEGEEDVAGTFQGNSSSGLGITSPAQTGTGRRASIQAIPRHTFTSNTLSPPGSANPFADNFPHDSSIENTPDLRRDRLSPAGTLDDFPRGVPKITREDTTGSADDYQHYVHNADTERLRGAPSIRSAYDYDFRPIHECPTARHFVQSRFTWLNMSIIIICVFSCIFSGIFLSLAIREPFYGRRITSNGPLTPAGAMLLTTIFAKVIEISFVTSFVAFLGQVLSRRAFMKEQGRGVTLSELSMWRWVVQPGTLITHFETAKYAGLSLMGILSLVSASLATLYTSASTALVQPMLKEGSWKDTVLAGRVITDFANVNYIRGLCPTPIRTDHTNSGSTCLQIEHAGQGYHNYQRYLAFWDAVASNGSGTTKQNERPPGFGLLYENTTITAQWINVIDTAEVSNKHGRAINNVSLAMPHAGVFEAARNPRNNILQPEDLNSEGTYSLRASVPSPVMNVICVNMNKEELKPIVYDTWNDDLVNITSWTSPGLMDKATTTNKTAVDDIFGWSSDSRVDYPPVFAKYPKSFNTLMNHTSVPWGRSAIYLLGQGGPADDGRNLTDTFSVCKIEVSISPECTTQYNARSGGGTMQALCEDQADDMEFSKHHPEAEWKTSVPNWLAIGFDWANALSLQTGIMDGDASNSRLLTQLMLNPSDPDPKNLKVDLSPVLPSMGEALAVMSGCTLLKSMMDAPFVMKWNYTQEMLDQFQTQYFNASLKAQQYASGGMDGNPPSKAWFAVLGLVFGMNLFVLGYFIIHRGLVTDFSEPPNLFALAVNSPPSHVLAGSCGGGPEGKQYASTWYVNHEGSHLFVESGEKAPLLGHANTNLHGPVEELAPLPSRAEGGFFARTTGAIRRGLGIKGPQTPQKLNSTSAVESLRSSQSRPVSLMGSEYEMEEGHERTRRAYEQLAKRRSRL